MNVAAPNTLVRSEIPDQYKWDLTHIFSSWGPWEEAYHRLEAIVDEIAALKGTLSEGPERVLTVFRRHDEMEKLAHKVFWYPSLLHDQNTKNSEVEGRRQRVSVLLSRSATATAWLNPELLSIGWETMDRWLNQNEDLALYRFVLEDLHRQQKHVLEETNERILSYSLQLRGTPRDAYSMLSTADVSFPKITLSTGEEVTVTHGKYQSILNTAREQSDRSRAFHAIYELYAGHANTYAALYNGVCQNDWFITQARNYDTSLEAALDGNNIPKSVVENLLTTTKAGVAPLRRYYELRKRVLGLETIHLYDGTVPLLETDRAYPYDEAVRHTLDSVAALGEAYQARVREAFEGGWIDVYENEGKRSGAYSAGVYGVHPYMLLNYNDTMDNMFTLAHEMGHSMHTVLSHETQPFVYSSYTIFVAEVASTLNEALLLDHLLERESDPAERILLLQHAIDSIVGTFYTQVLFADFELQAHRLVEAGEPVTVDSLSDIYTGLLRDYYGDVVTFEDLYRYTWARIPHFYRSPYYVYQYATCFASAAKIKNDLSTGDATARAQVLERYLTLLRSGGNDYPMEQLRKAGVDLSRPETVQAVIDQLDGLVAQLDREISRLRIM